MKAVFLLYRKPNQLHSQRIALTVHNTLQFRECKAQDNYKENFKEQGDYTTYPSIQLLFFKKSIFKKKKKPPVPLEQNESLPLTSSHSRYPQLLMPYASVHLLLCNEMGLARLPCMTPELSP